MAWPLTPYQTFSANKTNIGYLFLNAIQDGIVWIVTGARTIKILYLDGVGGATPATETLGADSPLARFLDSTGNTRAFVDHHGFVTGRLGSFVEQWDWPIQTEGAGTGQFSATSRWTYNISGGNSSIAQVLASGLLSRVMAARPRGKEQLSAHYIHPSHFVCFRIGGNSR